MINEKIDSLFETIYNTKEYIEYKKIKDLLNTNEEIRTIIENIKKLQKEATHLEVNNDNTYKEIDKNIKDNFKLLESYPLYNEYINKKEQLNDILSSVTYNLNQYLDNIIN